MINLNLENKFKNYGAIDNPVVCIKDAAILENIGLRGMNIRIQRNNLKTVKIDEKKINPIIPRGVYISDLSSSAQRRYYESQKSVNEKLLEESRIFNAASEKMTALSQAVKSARAGEIIQSNKIQIQPPQNNKDLKLLDNVANYNRERAFKKYGIIQEFKNYEFRATISRSKTEIKKTEILKTFLNNCEIRYYGKVVKASTFYDWLKSYEECGIIGLATDYGKRKGSWNIEGWNKEARAYFEKLYLSQTKPTISECYKELERESKAQNWKIPAMRTVERYVESMPYSALVYYREGEKMFHDKIQSYFERDANSIVSNEVWVSDHHQLDIAVKWWDGSVIFPWVTMFIDMRSWKVVGSAITLTPNSQSIMTAFKRAITKYGLPKWVYIDNGKDFVSKRFMGGDLKIGKAIAADEIIKINGIYAELKIEVINALPFNPQAKTIERYFRILEDQFGKFTKGYRGNRVSNRPEQLKKEIADGNLYHISQLRNMFDDYIERYNNESGREDSKYLKGLSPNECYKQNLDEKNICKANPESIRLLMMPIGDNEIKSVRRNGIYLRKFDKWYKTPETLEIGTKVIARYDVDNPNELYIYDLNQRLIAICEERKPIPILTATKEDFASVNGEKKNQRKNVREYMSRINKELENLNLSDKLKFNEFTKEITNTDTGEVVNITKTTYDNAKEKIDDKRRKLEKKQEELRKFCREGVKLLKAAGELKNPVNPNQFTEKEKELFKILAKSEKKEKEKEAVL